MSPVTLGTSSGQPRRKVGKAVAEALANGAPDVDLSALPNLTDMSAESLTQNVIAVNSMCTDPRLKFVMEKLVLHMHSFVREVGLTSEEWIASILFLTRVGQTCSDIRQEFILLSDIFGISALVDTMNHPTAAGSAATEATILGPFFTEDAADIPQGGSIASEGKGEYMYCQGRVSNTKGEGVAGCVIDTWETDEDGLYDTQYPGRETADCRGRLVTDKDGFYSYRAVLPVAYPIPNDGPVGKLLRALHRHVFRPAHLHMKFEAQGYEPLTTALYFKGDGYLTSDAVFGVKSSLIVETKQIDDDAAAKKLGFKSGPYHLLERDYVLQTEDEAGAEKKKSLAPYYASIRQ